MVAKDSAWRRLSVERGSGGIRLASLLGWPAALWNFFISERSIWSFNATPTRRIRLSFSARG